MKQIVVSYIKKTTEWVGLEGSTVGHLSQAQSFLFLTWDLFLFIVYWCYREECCYKAWTVLAGIHFFRNVGNGFVCFLACLSSVQSGFLCWRKGWVVLTCLLWWNEASAVTAITLSGRGQHWPARGHWIWVTHYMSDILWVTLNMGDILMWEVGHVEMETPRRGQSSGITLRCCELVPAPQPCLGHGSHPCQDTLQAEAPGSPQGLGSSRDVFSKQHLARCGGKELLVQSQQLFGFYWETAKPGRSPMSSN